MQLVQDPFGSLRVVVDACAHPWTSADGWVHRCGRHEHTSGASHICVWCGATS